MEKSGNKKAIIVITSIVLLGVGGFFAYKWNKKRVAKKAEEAKKIADAAAAAAAAAADKSKDDKSKDDKPKDDKPKADKPKYTFPAAWTTKEGDAFRAYVIAKDKAFADSINLEPTGKLNDWVQKAWDKYGTIYTNKDVYDAAAAAAKYQKDFNDAKAAAIKLGLSEFKFNNTIYLTGVKGDMAAGDEVAVDKDAYVVSKLPRELWSQNNQGGLETNTSVSLFVPYPSGASSYGVFYQKELVGKVLSIIGDSVKIENTNKPAKNAAGDKFTQFYMNKKGLTGKKPA